MRKIFLIIIAICLTLQYSYSQWPTEPHEGVELINAPDDWVSLTRLAPDPRGGYSFVVRLGDSSGFPEYPEYWYSQSIDLEGNLRYSSDNYEDRLICSDLMWKTVYYPAVAIDGSMFVVWADYRDSDWDPHNNEFPINCSLYMQKLNPDGLPEWDENGVLLQYHNHEEEFFVNAYHIEPLSDGGVIVVWEDLGSDVLCAQRYDQNGNSVWTDGPVSLWEDPPLRPFSLRNKEPISDGSGGFLFFLYNDETEIQYPIYLLPNGTLAWDPLDYELEGHRFTKWTKWDENNYFFISNHQGGNYDNYIFGINWLISGIYYNSNFLLENERGKYGCDISKSINNSILLLMYDGVMDPAYRLYEFTTEFIPLLPDTMVVLNQDDFEITGNCQLSPQGVRTLARIDGFPGYSPGFVVGYDLQGEQVWSHQIHPGSTATYPEGAGIMVDPSGNTWVLYTIYDGNNPTQKVNVIDPDGNWGQAVYSDVKEDIKPLPSQLSVETYPNPFNNRVNLSIDLTKREKVTVKIFDILGREVAEIHKGELKSGINEFSWNAEGIASGLYLISIQTESGENINKKIYHLK